MGVREVLLLGGEPTINDDIFAIIDYLKQFSLDKICLTTNGIRLAYDPIYAERLFSSGITHVNISLMSENTEQQMYISRTRRCITRHQLSLIKEIADQHGVIIRINNNIFKGNHDNMESVLSFYNFVRPYCHSVKFSPLLKTDNFSTVNEVTEFNQKIRYLIRTMKDCSIQLKDHFLMLQSTGILRHLDLLNIV